MKYVFPILILTVSQSLQAQNQDCTSAQKICDKNTLSVPASSGAGVDNTELDLASCFSGGAPGSNEIYSSWFYWDCNAAGNLTFVASPNDPTHDLDFVVYRIPDGGSCNSRQLVRCMAAGDWNPGSPCMGPTGLAFGNTDTEGTPGCSNILDNNNFLAPLQMLAGETYILCINNFSTGAGFTLEFGGTADIECAPLAIDEVLSVNMAIYPNPARDRLFIQTNGTYAGIEIQSIDGQCIKYLAYQSNGYDLSGMPAGVYAVHLLDQHGARLARAKAVLMGH
jgi:hypothetical protein